MSIHSIKSKWFSPIIVLTIFTGIAISSTAFIVMRGLEMKATEIEFRRAMDNRVASFKREMDIHFEVLFSLKGLYIASEFVTRDEFKRFSSAAHQRYPSIQALEWIPRILLKDKEVYEAKAREDGLSNFRITERKKQGQMTPVGGREEYFPVYYVEPYQGNELALGFDLASSPKRLKTLIQSRKSGEILATARIRLVQEKENQFGFLLFLPIYEGKHETPNERYERLKGFVLGVFRIGDIFEKSIEYVHSEKIGINLGLYDESAPQEERLLHVHQSPTRENSDLRFEYKETLQVGGRTWSIQGNPTVGYLQSKQTWIPYSAFFIGLLFTSLLAAYIQQRRTELKSIQEQNTTIVENAVNGIITIDQQGTIELFNPAAEKIFGYTAQEVLGSNVNILMPEPDSGQHDHYLNTYLETGMAKIIGIGREVTAQRKDKILFPMDLSISEMISGNKKKFVGILVDITERKAAEQLIIKEKEAAEAANRLKTEFLNTISHELRTPLTVMLGNLPLLTEPQNMPDAEEVAEIALEVEDSGNHLLTLINDLLDLSKIEAGKMDLHPEQFFVSAIVDEVVTKIQPLANKKGVTLTNQIEELEMLADPIRLKQVLFNLLSNAIKFTDEGRVFVTVHPTPETVLFEIRDTGCGMDRERLPIIFDAFRQVDGSSTRNAQGTGLGLAITKKLIELHGGEISVTSEIGKGSTFTFSIPQNGAYHENFNC